MGEVLLGVIAGLFVVVAVTFGVWVWSCPRDAH